MDSPARVPGSPEPLRIRGRLLDDGDFYWFPDEFGQFVRKCKNERDCSAHRKDEAEKAFREALWHNHKGKGYWIMG